MSPAACERCSDWVRSAFLERELLFTGIGGQGVQLAAQVLARAAMAEGREVQLFGSYGGMMRGGNTDATVVVADDTIESPPTVTNAWSAIIMHHEYAPPTLARVRRDGLVLINSTVVTDPPPIDGQVVLIPATDLAAKAGNIIGASLVMLGAYVAITGVVGLDTAVAAVADALPSYRSQHIASGQAAIRVGFDAAPAASVPAWIEEVTAR
jgi:Pyruvate/2-oxoacid:ferredoxin oxidoreductase gamma subunit